MSDTPYTDAKRKWALIAAYAICFALVSMLSKHVIPWHLIFS